MHDLLITNGDVLYVSLTGEVQIKHRHDVSIIGNRIAAVEAHGTLPVEQAREIIDATGMVVMPGLINTHSHVPMVIFRGLAEDVSLDRWFNDFIWPLESNLKEEDVYWGMLLGLAEMIEAGVTCVADHYFHMHQAARAVTEAGTRAALAWVVFGSQGEAALEPFGQPLPLNGWVQPAGALPPGWRRMRPTLATMPFWPPAPNAPASWGRASTSTCRRQPGKHKPAWRRNAALRPFRCLRRRACYPVPTILAHAVGATAADISLLSRRDCGIAHCPKTYLKLAMGTAPVVAFRDAGIPVGLATDGAVSNNTLDVWESMRLMAMTQKQAQSMAEVMPIADVLHVATRESAQVVGLGRQIGAIEPGCLADVILVDTSGAHMQPLHSVTAGLVYASRACDVRTVIVDGKVIMRDRQLLTLDKAEIIKQVNGAMLRLAQRTPGQTNPGLQSLI